MLMVDVSRASSTRHATGVDRARRRYLGSYARARHAHRVKPGVAFAALGGPGERAFLRATEFDSDDAIVMFRSGETLVKTSFISQDDFSSNVEHAYEAVRAVAKRLGQR